MLPLFFSGDPRDGGGLMKSSRAKSRCASAPRRLEPVPILALQDCHEPDFGGHWLQGRGITEPELEPRSGRLPGEDRIWVASRRRPRTSSRALTIRSSAHNGMALLVAAAALATVHAATTRVAVNPTTAASEFLALERGARVRCPACARERKTAEVAGPAAGLL